MTARVREVLVVEDDDAHAELIERAFEDVQGLCIARASSLREARERLLERPPAVVITDLRLPDGDGAELIGDPGTAICPVIVMTSFGDQTIAVDAMRHGALDYVVKSDLTFAEMPRIAERALREWSHLIERRRAEEALRRSEEQFRSLIENALDLIALVEPDGRLRYVSPSLMRILGWSPAQVEGRSVLELAHPEERERLQELLEDAVSGPGQPRFSVLRVPDSKGDWRSLEVVASLARGAEARAVVVNARDITERLRADAARAELADQLRQAQKLETLGTLAGGIAHDFNNILQALMGCTELAQASIPAQAPARRYLDRSLEVARRGRDLVRQILQFSRQETHHLEPVELQSVVAEVTRLLRATLPPGIELREGGRLPGRVLGDASQLHQVLVNLATNARQAMGARGGVLEIGIERHVLGPGQAGPATLPAGGYLAICVSDTGPGILSEIRERIFEPFFTTKAVGAGTGLGLSVAHGIVKSHGGAIVCESEVGRGTRFRVFLPESGHVAAAAGERAQQAAATRARLLLVDDDESVLFVGRSVLESIGHQVAALASGPEALELFAGDPAAFDGAILDEVMPRMTGSQLAVELRRLRPGLPVIIASGHGQPPAASFLEGGSVRFLGKPFEARELAEAVELLLRGGAGAPPIPG